MAIFDWESGLNLGLKFSPQDGQKIPWKIIDNFCSIQKVEQQEREDEVTGALKPSKVGKGGKARPKKIVEVCKPSPLGRRIVPRVDSAIKVKAEKEAMKKQRQKVGIAVMLGLYIRAAASIRVLGYSWIRLKNRVWIFVTAEIVGSRSFFFFFFFFVAIETRSFSQNGQSKFFHYD